MRPGFVSLFSGALGLDLGLERAGLTPLVANEIDRSALATIQANRPTLPVFAGDVRGLTPSDVAEVAGWEPFAVVGGPPCQPFSTAGVRRGLKDVRGSALLTFLELAVGLRARYVVLENVRGLLSAPLLHRPHIERGKGFAPLSNDELPGGALKRIVAFLEEAGYGVSFQLYNVAHFGVPQLRERVVLVAASDGRIVPHLIPTHGEGEWVSFRSAVSGLTEHGACASFRPGRAELIEKLREGQNWRSLDAADQVRALGGAYQSSGGRAGFCRRLSWDRPSPTLVTCPTMPATELCHPSEVRPLSVGEYRRLQTFPDDWKVCGSLSAQYRQMGNAVPVRFGEAIGRHLLAVESGKLRGGNGGRVSRYKDTDEESWRRRMA